jgi:hypothetical protein
MSTTLPGSGTASGFGRTQCLISSFARFNADGVEDGEDKDFAIAAATSVKALVNGVNNAFHIFVVADHFGPHLGRQLNVGEIPIMLAKAGRSGNGQPWQVSVVKTSPVTATRIKQAVIANAFELFSN